MVTADDIVLRLPQVMALIGLRKASIYRLMAIGDFPPGFLLGPHSRGWLRSDILRWIEARARGQSKGWKEP